jgi:methyl-accepting chemotaxis protein
VLGCIVDRDLSVASDEKYISQDEIGQLCASGMAAGRLNTYLSYIREITSVLNVMADGDMRVSLHYDYNGEFAAIKSVLLGIRFYEPNAVSD